MLVRGSTKYDCIVVNKKAYHKIAMLVFSVISVTDVRVNRAECQIMKYMPNKRIFSPDKNSLVKRVVHTSSADHVT